MGVSSCPQRAAAQRCCSGEPLAPALALLGHLLSPGPGAQGQFEWQPRDSKTQHVKRREGLMTRAEVKAAWSKQGLKLARTWGQIHISKVERQGTGQKNVKLAGGQLLLCRMVFHPLSAALACLSSQPHLRGRERSGSPRCLCRAVGLPPGGHHQNC